MSDEPDDEMRSSADRAATAVLIALQIIGSLFAVAVTFLGGMSVGPCVETCDYDLKWFAFALTPVVALAALVAVVVAVVVLRMLRPNRLAWWIPALGIALVGCALTVSLISADVAMRV